MAGKTKSQKKKALDMRSIVSGGYLNFWWYSPSTERKSGMPLSVETPAPPKKTMFFVSAKISSNARIMQTAPFVFAANAL